MRSSLATRAITVAALLLTTVASGQVASKAAWQAMTAAKTFAQVAISPDGKQVAWVQNGHINLAESHAGAAARQVSAGKQARDEASVAWSPDSKMIAFLSDAAAPGGQQQLYVANAATGAARKLTSVKGFLASPSWSPDGKSIALLFTENAQRASGPLVAEVAQTGVIKEAVTEQRLAIVDVSGGMLKQISPADMYCYEYDWSPDSQRLVTSAAHGNGDNNWWVAQLYTIAAAGGAMQPIYKPSLQIANPAWSRDGKSIAFIEGLMSDFGFTGGDVFVVPAGGGAAKNLTPEIKASPSWLTWTRAGEVLFAEHIDGGSGVATVDPATGAVRTLFTTPDRIGANALSQAVSLADDGLTAAMIRESFSKPPEIWAGPFANPQPITAVNAGVKPAWGEANSIHWTNDGFNLQGWLLYPANFQPNQRYPMVVSVHGGPSGSMHATWPSARSYVMALAASGYFVFFPNPRGSYGEGEAFTRANVKDFGYGDWRDIMTGVDAVLKQAPVDEHRLGLTGWSYGGYMTMWGVTQTRRFAAAVAGAGVANFQSYYGENSIDQWMIPFFGASVYDDPQVYARSSPITFIKNVKTPTLVVVGDSDGECPTPQSYEFWHALKALGVETELVVYEHEGHMFVDPEHQRDLADRTLAWFEQHMK
jgi:dipeptidyl aminopeptidase/acylaminoacyl peptidase